MAKKLKGRPPALPARAVARYVAGEAGRDALAAELGLSEYAVERALRALGVWRGKAAAMSAHFARQHGRRWRQVLRLRELGWAVSRIAAHCGVSRQRAYQILHTATKNSGKNPPTAIDG